MIVFSFHRYLLFSMSLHLLKPSFVISIFAIIILLIMVLPSQFLFNNPEFHQRLTELTPSGITGMLFLYLVLSLLTSIALPRQIAAFICGYSFGFVNGTVIATLAATTGCFITLIVARKCLTTWVEKQWPSQQKKVLSFLTDKLFYKAIVIRILPIGSNFLCNIIVGACRISAKPYLLGSLIGFIPQMIIFSLAGAGVKLGSQVHLITSFILFIIATIMSIWLYKTNPRFNNNN